MQFKSEWILKGIVESVFVVGSILMALGLDEWAENRGFSDLADQSLAIFEREILQNQARVVDVDPYHRGIRSLLGQMREGAPEGFEVRAVMEGIEAPVLQNTAWQTALATGALTHIDFEVVTALSLTYNIQERFGERREPPRLVGDRLSTEEAIAEALDYMSALTGDESELMGVYNQALQILRAHRSDGRQEAGPVSADDSAGSPRP